MRQTTIFILLCATVAFAGVNDDNLRLQQAAKAAAQSQANAIATQSTIAKKAESSITVNGHPLTGDVVISPGDLGLATVATSGSYTDLAGQAAFRNLSTALRGGLGSAAYSPTTAFDPAGTAAGKLGLTDQAADSAKLGGTLASTVVSGAAAGGTALQPGGALGTPASGTLTNCTFPPLNQSTTGTSGGLTGTPNIVVGTLRTSGNAGIGAVSSASIGVDVSGAHSGTLASLWGVASEKVYPATTTSSAIAYQGYVTTAAAAFTLANAVLFRATNPTAGSGSSITNVYGFECPDLTRGGTLNIAFHGAVGAGTGKWNLFLDGTAANHMSGTLLLGTVTDHSGEKLQVAGTGYISGNTTIGGSLVVNTGGSANKAICWKSGTTLGYCSTQPDSTGACTCN